MSHGLSYVIFLASMSIIIDTMDQKKSEVPAPPARHSDTAARLQRLKVQIIGVINHADADANDDGFQVFLGIGDEFAADSNTNCQVIWSTLQRFFCIVLFDSTRCYFTRA
jgi:hypothetical protein